MLIAVLMHSLFVIFFNLFVFHLHWRHRPNAVECSIDYSDWLVQVTELIDK